SLYRAGKRLTVFDDLATKLCRSSHLALARKSPVGFHDRLWSTYIDREGAKSLRHCWRTVESQIFELTCESGESPMRIALPCRSSLSEALPDKKRNGSFTTNPCGWEASHRVLARGRSSEAKA